MSAWANRIAGKGVSMNSDLAILQWYLDAGVDEAIADVPWDRTSVDAVVEPAPQRPAAAQEKPAARKPEAGRGGAPLAPPAPPAASPPPALPQLAAALVEELAAIQDLEALRARLDTFDGCTLKATAMNTVFGTGPADADLMIVGEAPGEQEDRQGVPFVGPSGNLLDLMLNAIGLARSEVYVTNTIYWRPPGNRTPTLQEVMACSPFLHRQIALIQPKVLLMVGGAAAKTLLQRSEGIMRLRGRWFEVAVQGASTPIPAMATFHPAYLLRSPAQKREAWQDLQAVRSRLRGGST